MGTYFFICVQTSKGQAVELGPYLTLKEASEIFAEHIPAALLAQGIQTKQYTAQLLEVYPTISGWNPIGVKIETTETYDLEGNDESTT